MSDTKLPPAEPPPAYKDVASTAPPTRTPRIPPPLDLPALTEARRRRTILASASPRRRQLLAQIGLSNVEVVPSAHPENIPKNGLSPFEYVLQTAAAKALTVYKAEIDSKEKDDPGLVIAADTVIVSWGGEILEKPRSEKSHVEMLRGLRDGGRIGGEAAVAGLGAGMRGEGMGIMGANGSSSQGTGWHRVFTAVAILAPMEEARAPGYVLETVVEETAVKFDPNITDELILSYVRTREGADKAGGYGIQGMGTLLVERIEGTWDNVVGLPLRATLKLIEKVISKAADEEDEDDLIDAGED